MAAWRRRALAVFPELHGDLLAPGATLITFGWRLVELARRGHAEGDAATLRRVYGFALWCYQQRAPALWNSIGVAFYEHLLDRRADRRAVLAWLAPELIEQIWPLWEWRLGTNEMVDVRRTLDDVRQAPKLPWKTVLEGGIEQPSGHGDG